MYDWTAFATHRAVNGLARVSKRFSQSQQGFSANHPISLALQTRFISSDGLSTMSSAVVGKFQDHYEVLGIDPKADSETVQRAYTKLAQRYHFSNADTGDQEKFEAVNLAYEILSDPILRPEFDRVKGIPDDTGPPRFSGLEFFENLGRGTGLRTALLCVLYDRRRNKPFTPSLSMRQIENIVEGTPAELTFVLWFLKQRSFIASDDKSSLQITVIGMDFLEANPPDPKLVMRFIKLSGMVGSKGDADAAATETPVAAETIAAAITPVVAETMAAAIAPPAITGTSAAAREGLTALGALNRALSRTREAAVDLAEQEAG